MNVPAVPHPSLTGWLVTPKLGTDLWYVVEIPGGYAPGMPFPQDAKWHEHLSEAAAWDSIKQRFTPKEDE